MNRIVVEPIQAKVKKQDTRQHSGIWASLLRKVPSIMTRSRSLEQSQQTTWVDLMYNWTPVHMPLFSEISIRPLKHSTRKLVRKPTNWKLEKSIAFKLGGKLRKRSSIFLIQPRQSLVRSHPTAIQDLIHACIMSVPKGPNQKSNTLKPKGGSLRRAILFFLSSSCNPLLFYAAKSRKFYSFYQNWKAIHLQCRYSPTQSAAKYIRSTARLN